jgi:hypothetical protein
MKSFPNCSLTQGVSSPNLLAYQVELEPILGEHQVQIVDIDVEVALGAGRVLGKKGSGLNGIKLVRKSLGSEELL